MFLLAHPMGIRGIDMQWFNFKTCVFEESEGPQTDEEALQYIPDIPAARGLFQVHRLMGKSIEEAMAETLSSCIGDKQPKLKKWWKFWSK